MNRNCCPSYESMSINSFATIHSCGAFQMAELRRNLSAEQDAVKQRQEQLETKERETEELKAEIQGLISLL